MSMRPAPGLRGSAGATHPKQRPKKKSKGQISAREHLYHRQVVETPPTPREAYDPVRQKYQTTHPPNPSGVGALATGSTGNPVAAYPTTHSAINTTIPAASPFAPGQPGGPPINSLNPQLLGSNFGGAHGTFYGQYSSFGGPQVTSPDQNPPPAELGTAGSEVGNDGGNRGSGNRRRRRKSDGGKGGSGRRRRGREDKGRDGDE